MRLTFATDISRLTNLTRLSVRSNQLKELPAGLTTLNKLAILDLGQNSLRELPVHFGRLSSLKQLYLSANKLIALPQDIGASLQSARTALTPYLQAICAISRRSTVQ